MSTFDVAAALNFPELPKHIECVEQKLAKVLPATNPYIDEPIARLLRAGGKRLRPSLALSIVASQGKTIDQKIIASCVAIECVHLASLVHDDVIDNAESRHGTTTINHQEGVNRAILIGDYLLARALEQAAIASQEIAQTLAAAFAAMCDGQARELSDIGNTQRTQASYLQTIRGKTAALFSATCRIGGLCAGLPEAQLTVLASFGENFGMSYQLIDDVLDFIADPKLFGKPTGTDIRENNYTLPILLALAGPPGQKLEILLNTPDKAVPEIRALLLENQAIQETISKAKSYNQAAVKTVNQFKTLGLRNLPDTYTVWTFKYLVN